SSKPFISMALSSVSSKTLNSFGRLLLPVETLGIAKVYKVGGGSSHLRFTDVVYRFNELRGVYGVHRGGLRCVFGFRGLDADVDSFKRCCTSYTFDVGYRVLRGLFLGIPIDNSLVLSHLFFVDDAIFVGKWDSLNIRAIVNVLKCFHLASGLEINFHKSKLMGIDTRLEEVNAAAITMSYLIFTTPFVHLKVKLLEATTEFFVKSVRQITDDLILLKEEVATRWVKVMSIKINVFALRVRLDKPPTRLNLSLKGIDVSPLCHASVEFGSHILFSCHMARQLWRKLIRWCQLEDIDLASYDDWLIWLNSSRLSKRLKEILEGVCYVKWWLIWRFRNQLLFGATNSRRELLFYDLV
nr:RNA-directed DNA polymerase, eukaryota [Tanacetum cinerariifolium]